MDILDTHSLPTLFLWGAAMLILAGILASRFISKAERFITRSYQELDKRRVVSLIQVTSWVLNIILWIIIIVKIGSKAGLPPSLVAGAGTLIGAGVGFGAQSIFRDVMQGTLRIGEEVFAVGDVVSLATSSGTYTGTVIAMNLRTVTLSTMTSVVHVPQGDITIVETFSSGLGKILISMPFDTDVDIKKVLSVVERVVSAIDSRDYESMGIGERADDLEYVRDITVMGVSDITAGSITVDISAESDPDKNFAAKRALSLALVVALAAEGITVRQADILPGA